MSGNIAVQLNGAEVMDSDGVNPWPWRSGLVIKTQGLRSLPIPVHSEVVIFLLGDLIGRKLRVSSDPVSTEIDPGRVTILTDKQGRIVDMWVDPDPEQRVNMSEL